MSAERPEGPPAAGTSATETHGKSLRHDLRTPINHIIGYCEMLQEEEQVPRSFLADLAKIHEGGRQLLALINEYFDEEKFEIKRRDLRQVADVTGTDRLKHGEIKFFIDDEMRKTARRKNANAQVRRPGGNRLLQCAAERDTAFRSDRIGRVIGVDEDRNDRDHTPGEIGPVNIRKGMTFVLIRRDSPKRANVEFCLSQPLNQMQLIAVPSRRLLMVRIKNPFLQADGVDDKRISVPFPDRITHPG